MIYTEDQKRNILKNAGYNPDLFDFDENTSEVIPKQESAGLDFNKSDESLSPPLVQSNGNKFSKFGTFGRHAAASTFPTVMGTVGSLLGMGALAETGPVGMFAGGVVGGISGAQTGETIQEPLLPEGFKRSLGESQEQNPIMALAGSMAPSALFFNPLQGARRLPELVRGIRNLPKQIAKPANKIITPVQKSVLINAGANVGIAGAQDVYAQRQAMEEAEEQGIERPFSYKELALHSLPSVIFNEPTRLGKRIGFTGTEDIERALAVKNARIAQEAEAYTEAQKPKEADVFKNQIVKPPVTPTQEPVLQVPVTQRKGYGVPKVPAEPTVQPAKPVEQVKPPEPTPVKVELETQKKISEELDKQEVQVLTEENAKRIQELEAAKARLNKKIAETKDVAAKARYTESIRRIQGGIDRRKTAGKQNLDQQIEERLGTIESYSDKPEITTETVSPEVKERIKSRQEELASRRGFSIREVPEILNKKGESVAGVNRNIPTRELEISATKGGTGTTTHEGMHGFLEDLRTSNDPKDRALVERGESIFKSSKNPNEEFVKQAERAALAKDFRDLYGKKREKFKAWWEDTKASWKTKFGLANDEDVKRNILDRYYNDIPFSESLDLTGDRRISNILQYSKKYAELKLEDIDYLKKFTGLQEPDLRLIIDGSKDSWERHMNFRAAMHKKGIEYRQYPNSNQEQILNPLARKALSEVEAKVGEKEPFFQPGEEGFDINSPAFARESKFFPEVVQGKTPEVVYKQPVVQTPVTRERYVDRIPAKGARKEEPSKPIEVSQKPTSQEQAKAETKIEEPAPVIKKEAPAKILSEIKPEHEEFLRDVDEFLKENEVRSSIRSSVHDVYKNYFKTGKISQEQLDILPKEFQTRALEMTPTKGKEQYSERPEEFGLEEDMFENEGTPYGKNLHKPIQETLDYLKILKHLSLIHQQNESYTRRINSKHTSKTEKEVLQAELDDNNKFLKDYEKSVNFSGKLHPLEKSIFENSTHRESPEYIQELLRDSFVRPKSLSEKGWDIVDYFFERDPALKKAILREAYKDTGKPDPNPEQYSEKPEEVPLDPLELRKTPIERAAKKGHDKNLPDVYKVGSEYFIERPNAKPFKNWGNLDPTDTFSFREEVKDVLQSMGYAKDEFNYWEENPKTYDNEYKGKGFPDKTLKGEKGGEDIQYSLIPEHIPITKSALESIESQKTPQSDTIHEAFNEFYRKFREYKGKYVDPITRPVKDILGINKSIKGYLTQNNESSARVVQYLDDIADTGKSSITPTAQEKKAIDAYRAWEKDFVSEVNSRAGLKKQVYDPNMFRQIASGKVINTVLNKRTTPEGQALIKDFLKYQTTVKGNSLTDAKENLKTFLKGYNKDAVNIAKQFNQIDASNDIGIPPSWREKNLLERMSKLGLRVARRLAYHDTIESNPSVVDAIENPETGNISDPVREVLQDIGGINPQAERIREGLNRIVRSNLLGPLTGAKDLVTTATLGWQHQTLGQAFRAQTERYKNFKQNYEETFQQGLNRESFGAIESGEDVIPILRRIGDISGDVSGRNWMEKVSRVLTYTEGKWLAADNFNSHLLGKSSKQTTKFLDDFGPKNWKTLKKLTPEQIKETASNYVESVQGMYDPRDTPFWAMKGSLSPIFSLAKWNIAKLNNFNKYVVQPAKDGNYTPLLMSTLGLAIGGTATQQLVELITNRKQKTPTLKEIDESEDKWKGILYKAAGLASLSGYAGMAGDLAKITGDIAFKNQPQTYNNILVEAASNIGETTVDLIQALENGDVSLGLDYIGKILEDNNQAVRILMAHPELYSSIAPEIAEKRERTLERRDKFRDYKMFRNLNDYPVGEINQTRANTFEDQDIKEFKQTEDVSKAIELYPKIVQQAISEANGDPEKLLKTLRGFKGNSYQTMPKPENNPVEFTRFFDYITKTQGSKKAQELLEDYRRQNAVNRAKSAMIP